MRKNKAIPSNVPTIRRRQHAMRTVFMSALTVICAYAGYLQIFQKDRLSRRAEVQYRSSLTIEGERGTIYDANMKKLALTNTAYSIAAYPDQIENKTFFAESIAAALGKTKEDIYKRISEGKSFIWLKRHPPLEEVMKLRKLNLKGIGFHPEYSRYYPNQSLAAQIIGFTGTDNIGLEGIEHYYNSFLKSQQSEVKFLRDAMHRKFNIETISMRSLSGKDLMLTIDHHIQFITELALEQTVSRYSAKSGIAIVMRPQTGEILAIAHSPTYDPNHFGRYHPNTRRNRAVTDPFEPGSTFKIFTIAAALDAGIATPESRFFCENGSFEVGKNTIRDTTPRGMLTLQEILKYSSNIGVVKVGNSLGPKNLYAYLKKFGFGEDTRIDVSGESAGKLASYNAWSAIENGTIAFGQGVSVTAIQLITAASAIANDGVMMQPYIVKAILDTSGSISQLTKPLEVGRVISTQSAVTLRKIMATVMTEGGTGTRAAINGVSVCGKTGTAQKIGRNGTYEKDRYVASFIGFAPEEKPKIAILVVVDEPKGEHYGGIVAAPAFKKIVLETLTSLDRQNNSDINQFTVSMDSKVRG